MPQIWFHQAIARTSNHPNNKPPTRRGDIMISNLKKLAGASVIAAGAAAALFGATGTAQAAVLTDYTNNGVGTIVTVTDTANSPGAVEICSYRSHVVGHPFLLPYFATVTLTGTTPSN